MTTTAQADEIVSFNHQKTEFVHDLHGLGHIYIGLSALNKALNCFTTVYDLAPYHIGAMVDAAYCLRETNRLSEAETLLNDALGMEPTNPFAQMGLAIIRQKQGNHADALALFTQVEKSISRHHDLGVLSAISLRAGNFTDEARARLLEVLSENPEHVDANLMIAEIALEREHYSEAVDFARKAADHGSHSSRRFLLLVTALLRDGRHGEASQELEAALKEPSCHPHTIAMQLQILSEQGRMPEAMDLLSRFEFKINETFDLWWQATYLSIRSGEMDRASAYLAKSPATSIEQDAEITILWAALATAYDDHASALKYYQAAQAKNTHRCLTLEVAQTGLSALDLPLVAETLTTRLPTAPQRAALAHCHAVYRAYQRDSSVIESLHGIEKLPEAAQTEAIVRLVRNHAESAPAARYLIRKLIDTGVFRSDLLNAHLSSEKTIPLNIFQYWEGDLADDVAAIMSLWSDMNADYQYVLLDREAAREFLRKHTWPRAVTAFDEAPQSSRRANIIRFAYLMVHGGIYVDADERCHVPLRNWLPHRAAFVGIRKEFGLLNCNFMAAEPGSHIMQLALEGAVHAILDAGPDPLWLTNGPGRLTKALASHAANHPTKAEGHVMILVRNSEQRFFSTDFSLAYKRTHNHWWIDEYGAA